MLVYLISFFEASTVIFMRDFFGTSLQSCITSTSNLFIIILYRQSRKVQFMIREGNRGNRAALLERVYIFPIAANCLGKLFFEPEY